jgi:hypothetical protein
MILLLQIVVCLTAAVAGGVLAGLVTTRLLGPNSDISLVITALSAIACGVAAFLIWHWAEVSVAVH